MRIDLTGRGSALSVLRPAPVFFKSCFLLNFRGKNSLFVPVRKTFPVAHLAGAKLCILIRLTYRAMWFCESRRKNQISLNQRETSPNLFYLQGVTLEE